MSDERNEAVPVSARQPSSASPTQQPESAPYRESLSLEDAAREVIRFVEQHRRSGDGDLDRAVEDLKSALPAVVEDDEWEVTDEA